MEKQAEYGEKRIVCPLYKLGWIISMNDANRDLIYCDGPACGMYPLCNNREAAREILEAVKGVAPGL